MLQKKLRSMFKKSVSQRDKRGRFDLLLLEDGEFFLDDFSANMCVVPPGGMPQLRILLSSKVRGRLKICTKSIMFDPDDISVPVTRYRFRDMPNCPSLHYRGNDGTARELGGDLFTIACSTETRMREDGTHGPYTSVGGSGGISGAKRSKDGTSGAAGEVQNMQNRLFALVHTRVDQVVSGQLQQLWEACQHSRSRWEEKKVLEPLLRNRIPTKFDNSLLADFSERPLLKSACYVDRVLPLVKTPGCLMVTSKYLYVQPAQLNNVGEPVFRCAIRTINHVHKRRHMLQQNGMEIFYDNERSSIFLAFSSSFERDMVADVLMKAAGNAAGLSSGDDQFLLREKTRAWQRREIDNYTYLLFLNTYADRSVNDLTQYPVFPWVVRDYKSASLDLDDPNTYRDLSKPIGALSPKRLSHFRQRFQDMPRAKPGRPLPEGIPPPFLYGTHYSTPGYVLFYLVRVAPEYMLCLQNGMFDAPDRMFFSIGKAWDSVMSNPADLKELIPEFYDTSSLYSGEFLRNYQELKMGTRQNGKRLHDVELPPWAKTPEELITKFREALESEYVSEHLHSWIDLIFGYRQRGEEAEKANNLFYHLTYEGAVDLENIEDPRERSSIEDQISEFGQTPKQIFKEPHPSRNGAVMEPLKEAVEERKPEVAGPPPPMYDKVVAPSQADTVKPAVNPKNPFHTAPSKPVPPPAAAASRDIPTRSTPERAGGLDVAGDLSSRNVKPENPKFSTEWNTMKRLERALTGDESADDVFGQKTMHRSAITSILTGISRIDETKTSIFTTSEDTTLKLHEYETESSSWNQRRSIRLSNLSLSSCAKINVENKEVIVVGSWDNSVYVYSVEMGLMIQQLNAHDDAVSCLAYSGEYVCTGSWDSTVKVWKLESKGLDVNPVFTGYDHDSEVNCVAMRKNIFVSGGNDGTLAVNDLLDGDGSPAFAFFENKSPVVDIKWYSNQRFICACEASLTIHDENAGWSVLYSVGLSHSILCLDTYSSFVVTGCAGGVIKVWNSNGGSGLVETFEFMVPTKGSPITAIGVGNEGKSLAIGTKSGTCMVYEH